MAKKKATKKAKKKVNSKVVAPTNDLFVEMSSGVPAVEPAVQAEYTWKTHYGEAPDQSLFATGLLCGTLLGFAIAATGVILDRLFA